MSDLLEDLLPELVNSEAAPQDPAPRTHMERHRAADRLIGRVALVTGGATGVGHAVAVGFAKEGADVAITWLTEREEAAETVAMIEAEGRRALSVPGDIGNPDFAAELVRQVVAEFGRIDILVNNAAEQHVCDNFEDIADDQVERTFRTNIFGKFWLTKAALPHMADGSCIINTSCISAYRGSAARVDYATTNGATVAFTRSLALQLANRGVRVNAVAPAHMNAAASDAPLARPAEPDDIAPSYIFLASQDAAYMTGQVLHPNGGAIVNG